MDAETTLTVGEVARLAHVSVRTLHHYDRLGLLTPSRRSEAGYRLYSEYDLGRLQQILLYKELGFGLGEIAELMRSPDFDRVAALERQRDQLATRQERLRAVAALVDATLATLKGEREMTHEELFEAFGDFDPAAHEDEARERWGDTKAYAESRRRTKAYTKDDWLRYRSEADELNEALAALMAQGVPPGDPRAVEAAERHRLLIDRWFYPCSPQMHAALGEMYVADQRFAATFDKVRPGLARYLRDASAAALEHGADEA
jgi:MerR family transcriptional regulator, thiopeptide resistance regulator